MIKSISGALLRKMFVNGAKLLDLHKEHINALNVFPVPDGDTGTNMSLTMMASAKDLLASSSKKMDVLCNEVSRGALRGARGNSGVILSQIIKGMSAVFAQHKDITTKVFAQALTMGAAISYKAVTKPQEGTILTVVKSIAEEAKKVSKKSVDFVEFFEKVMAAGEKTLKKTPDMLPVLKKAGVVDAGGRGFLVIMKGLQNVLLGNEDTNLEFEDRFKDGWDEKYSEDAHFDYKDLGEIEFSYCTEFSIINVDKKVTDKEIDKLRDKLMTMGDSVLVIGDLSLIKVHIHTNDPGAALSSALKLGEIDKIKIDNMLEQNRVLVNTQKQDLRPYGLVTICAGDGISSIFKDLTVDFIIEGGQTMNPSAESIAKACDRILAQDIFVFPNNKNIILAAEQARILSRRNLHIVPTKTIPQGLAAVLAFNPEESVEENLENMTKAMGATKTGLVTYAVRNTQTDKFKLKEGDIIGLDNKDIVTKGKEVGKVTSALIDKMMDKDIGNISLYFGNNVEECDAEKVAEELGKKYSRCDIDIHYGGQPLYYYIVSLE